jgi:phage shock protein C
MLAGVCGGLGETFGIDATIIRLIALVLMVPFSFLIGLLYLFLVVLLPVE